MCTVYQLVYLKHAHTTLPHSDTDTRYRYRKGEMTKGEIAKGEKTKGESNKSIDININLIETGVDKLKPTSPDVFKL